MGETRPYAYSLTSTDYPDLVYSGIGVNLSLFDHYPSLTTRLLDFAQIDQIIKDHRDNTLLNKTLAAKISITGVGTLLDVDDLVMNRVVPLETPTGLVADITLIPKFALFSAYFPQCLTLSEDGLNISEALEEILEKIPEDNRPILQYGARDVTCCVSPRFLNMSYLDMIGKICDFHGLHYFMDFDKNFWVYPGFKLDSNEPVALTINKHAMKQLSLNLDTIVYLQ